VQRQRRARAVRVDGARQRQVEAHVGLRPEGDALPPAAVHVQPQAPVRPALDPARPARTASAAAAGSSSGPCGQRVRTRCRAATVVFMRTCLDQLMPQGAPYI